MERRFVFAGLFQRVALLGLAVVLFGAALVAAPQPAAAAGVPAGSWVYQVTISGTASGRPFTRTGFVVLSPTITRVTTNGVNPMDVWLTSGNPIASPEVGAITFGTNNAFLGSSGAVDLAYVAYKSAIGNYGALVNNLSSTPIDAM